MIIKELTIEEINTALIQLRRQIQALENRISALEAR
jgi:BMFP domain-containing protein YqiC